MCSSSSNLDLYCVPFFVEWTLRVLCFVASSFFLFFYLNYYLFLFPFVALIITSWIVDIMLLTQHIVTFQSDSRSSASPADRARWILFELLPKYYMPQKINTDLWIWNKMVMHSNSSWFPWGIIPSNGLKFKTNNLYVAFWEMLLKT